jgi:hypothetical protein
VACDLFTVETIRLKTLHVLFFVHLSTRRIVAAGVTAHPDSAWVTQQARNTVVELDDRRASIRFLLRDHDAKFTRGFDDVFGSEGGQVLRTPIQAPKANAQKIVLTVKKSQARIPAACWRRNDRQLVEARRGAGSMPWARRILRVELTDTRKPRRNSSPWIRW